MEHIGEALGRFNKSLKEGDETAGKPEVGKDKAKGGKGHIHTVHVHKDGSYHHMVHHGGQMIHHSEHPSLDEAADSMKNFAAEEHAEGE